MKLKCEHSTQLFADFENVINALVSVMIIL